MWMFAWSYPRDALNYPLFLFYFIFILSGWFILVHPPGTDAFFVSANLLSIPLICFISVIVFFMSDFFSLYNILLKFSLSSSIPLWLRSASLWLSLWIIYQVNSLGCFLSPCVFFLFLHLRYSLFFHFLWHIFLFNSDKISISSKSRKSSLHIEAASV